MEEDGSADMSQSKPNDNLAWAYRFIMALIVGICGYFYNQINVQTRDEGREFRTEMRAKMDVLLEISSEMKPKVAILWNRIYPGSR